MKKRGNAARDADRLSAYEACRRVEGRAVNRLLFRFCAWRALTRRVRSYFVRLQFGVQPWFLFGVSRWRRGLRRGPSRTCGGRA
jgi:hypothetical protein